MTIVAVVLAYNATAGLPFVPTYTLHVQAADASELQHGDAVNMEGGTLVGTVSSVDPPRTSSGRPIALLNLKLYDNVKPLPVEPDVHDPAQGQHRSQVPADQPGHSRSRGFPDGATVPLSQTSTEVDFDQVLSMFTPPTRSGIQRSTIGFGEALAGRGSDLNNAIGAFVPLLARPRAGGRNLASPRTDLAGFFHGLKFLFRGACAGRRTQASLFGNLNTTFRALAGIALPPSFRTRSRRRRRRLRHDRRQPGDPAIFDRHREPAAASCARVPRR